MNLMRERYCISMAVESRRMYKMTKFLIITGFTSLHLCTNNSSVVAVACTSSPAAKCISHTDYSLWSSIMGIIFGGGGNVLQDLMRSCKVWAKLQIFFPQPCSFQASILLSHDFMHFSPFILYFSMQNLAKHSTHTSATS